MEEAEMEERKKEKNRKIGRGGGGQMAEVMPG